MSLTKLNQKDTTENQTVHRNLTKPFGVTTVCNISHKYIILTHACMLTEQPTYRSLSHAVVKGENNTNRKAVA